MHLLFKPETDFVFISVTGDWTSLCPPGAKDPSVAPGLIVHLLLCFAPIRRDFTYSSSKSFVDVNVAEAWFICKQFETRNNI